MLLVLKYKANLHVDLSLGWCVMIDAGSYQYMLRSKTSIPNVFMSGDWIVTDHGSWSQVLLLRWIPEVDSEFEIYHTCLEREC